MLLTTGLGLRGAPAGQAAYVEQLARADLAALGIGLGFAFKATPPAVLEAADRAGFPVFEVPFEVPFIAITEALFSRLVNEQYVLLQRAGTVQQTLSRLLVEGAGLDALLEAYARMTGTRALLLDVRGEVMAAARGATAVLPPRAVWAEIQALRPEGNEFSLSLSDEGGSRTLLPVLVGGGPAGFLVLHRGTRPEPFHQVVVHHLATAVALELAKAQAVARTERRLVGDFLDALLEGELSARRSAGACASSASAPPRRSRCWWPGARAPTARRRRWRRCGCWSRTGCRAARRRTSAASRTPRWSPCSRRPTRPRPARPPRRWPRRSWPGAGRPLRARHARGDPRGLRRAYQEARFALEAAGPAARVATGRPGQPPPAAGQAGGRRPGGHLPRPARPLADYDRRQHGDLVASLRAFLEHNGNWEAAARALAVHRHTLRYRIRRIAELTGRDLDRAGDRVEFWLALQAADVLGGRGDGRSSDTYGAELAAQGRSQAGSYMDDRGRGASVPSCPCGRIGGSAA